MVIGQKRSHVGGWVGGDRSKKAKEIEWGEEKRSADKKKKAEKKKKRKKGGEEYQPTYYWVFFFFLESWQGVRGPLGPYVAPSLFNKL